jgi:hypothetical protein
MFTTLTIAMSLTGAVPVEAPSIKANLDRPAVVQIAAADEFSSQRRDRNRRFGQGNISSGKNKGAERKLGDGLRRVGGRIREIANDGKGLIGVELAAPPGGNKPFGNGKGSNQQVFGNAKGSNAPAFGNGKGSNVGFGNGVGSNAPPPVGYKVGVPAGNAAPQGYATGAPQGYGTGQGIGAQGPQGYATGHGNKGYNAGQGQGSNNSGGYNAGNGQTGNNGGHNAGQAQQNPPLKIEPGLIPNTGNTGNGNNNAGQPAKLDELRQQIENAANKKS